MKLKRSYEDHQKKAAALLEGGRWVDVSPYPGLERLIEAGG